MLSFPGVLYFAGKLYTCGFKLSSEKELGVGFLNDEYFWIVAITHSLQWPTASMMVVNVENDFLKMKNSHPRSQLSS